MSTARARFAVQGHSHGTVDASITGAGPLVAVKAPASVRTMVQW